MIKTVAITVAFVSTAAWAVDASILTGDQIRQRIIGNTIVGTEDGAPVSKYFGADGFIRVEDKDGRYKGVWKIKGNELCVGYEDDNGNMDEAKECSTMALRGDRVIRSSDEGDLLTLKAGDSARGEILSGDQIRQRIIGNTLVEADEEAPVAKFFGTDGFIRVGDKDGNYKGVWKIKGNELCVGYEDDNGNMREAKECSAVELKGDRVTFSSDDTDSTLEKGNSRNLSETSEE
jgi:hypothetical protein